MKLDGHSTLLTKLDGGVLHVTLNRPAVRNAMSLEMVSELRQVLREAEGTDDVRVLVIRGAGGNFCSGGDIGDMAATMSGSGNRDVDPLAETSKAFGHICAAFSATSKAIVTVVEGVAMGGGFGLACVSDVCLASPDARFGLPETRLGLVPAQIAPFLVERLGYSRAKLLAVLGGNIRAEEALRLGLVHEMSDDIESALASSLESILACAPGALGATKRLLRKVHAFNAVDLIDEAASVFSAAMTGAEGREGTQAFMGKRPPAWSTKGKAK
ncbi:MAG: enoyl-CoA hydratase/isomerase family protein [Rhizobiaceae bacterium]